MKKTYLMLMLGIGLGLQLLFCVQIDTPMGSVQEEQLRSEIRSVWALPWDIDAPDKVARLMQTAIESHQNELLVEVRYRSDALFDTSRGAQFYPNPEPRSHVLKTADYDPLQDILEQAHNAGIKVHAWVITFNATPLDKVQLEQNYIYKNHPEWITYDRSGRRMSNSSQYGYYIDPGLPEVQDYLLNVIGNLVMGYPDLDGIHLDYIRYPNENLGYHPQSISRYQDYCLQQEEIGYNEWRIRQVSGFVERFHGLVKDLNPGMVTSAAVFADIADAHVQYAQDWPSWLSKGIIDRVYPMAYSTRMDVFAKQMQQYLQLGKNDAIVVGIRAWRDDNGSMLNTKGYNLADVVQRIENVRNSGLAGIALFSYAGMKPASTWDLLTQMCYPEIAYQKDTSLIETKDQPAISFIPRSKEQGYDLELWLPEEGFWNWAIEDSGLRYYHKSSYQKGANQEYWEGIVSDPLSSSVFYIPPGEYLVKLYRDNDPYQYLVPVTFAGENAP